MKVLGVSRSPRFSPNSVGRDAAIFEAVGKLLREQGHDVDGVSEDALAATIGGELHECYDAVFSMARDEQVLRSLSSAEEHQLPVFNSATALLGASRSALTALFEQAGIDASDTIMIGDRDYDVIGAHACNIPVAAVLHGYGDREELKDADYILEHFMDLVSL